MTDRLPWLARLLTPEGQRVVGAGILVDSHHVVTCAHVVNQALGRRQEERAPPDRPVQLDFLEAEDDLPVPARSIVWVPIEDERGDLCVLELDSDAPAGTRPAPLRRPARLRGHCFDTYGFPRGFDTGIGSQGEIGRPAGPGREWVQLEVTRTSGHRIAPGFSGAPVWDDSVGGVVGMVVTNDRDPQAKVAFMLPVRELARRWPPLDALVRACQLYGGGDQELTTHWSPRARGLERDFERGWYFTGRGQVLAELAGWLATPGADGQVRIITGDPGSGKSAVLARLVTLSDPRYRPRVPGLETDDRTVPQVGVIDVAVFVRRKPIAQVVGELALAVEVEADSPEMLIEQLGTRGKPFRVVVDGLDEASQPLELAGGLLCRLASDLASIGAKVLVGTRRGRRDALLRALGAGAVVYPLDQPPWLARKDLATYVGRRLLLADNPASPTPYRGQERLARQVAQAVATRAYPLYLVAQLTSKGLVQRTSVIDPASPDWETRFPTTVADSLDWYLSERFGPAKTKVVELLTPLAYAEGEGLPPELWAATASALADRDYSLDDVQWLLDTAADYLIEHTQDDTGPVYRLYHQALAESLRPPEDAEANQRNQRRFLAELTGTIPTGPDGEPMWSHTHPHILAHLAVYAAHAGQLDPLLADPSFILHADLDRLLGVLRHATTPAGRTTAGTIERASHHLRGGPLEETPPLEERAAYLQLVARQYGNAALAEAIDHASLDLAWRTPWVFWQAQAPNRVIGHHRGLSALAFAGTSLPDGQPIAISGGADGTIRFWDPATGAPRTDNLRAHPPGDKYGGDGVQQLATTTLPDGQPIAISGGADGTIRFWDPATGAPRTDNLRAHPPGAKIGRGGVQQLATTTLPDGQPIAISGGADGTIRFWDPATGAPLTDNLRAHRPGDKYGLGGVQRLAITTLPDGQAIAISGGGDGTIRFWDPATGAPRTDNLGAHPPGSEYGGGGVEQLAVTVLPDGQAVAITGDGRYGTVRLWDVATGTSHIDGIPVHRRPWELPPHPASGKVPDRDGWIQQLATTTLPDGEAIAITGGGYDGAIRLWDLPALSPRTDYLPAHQIGDVWSGGVQRLAVTTLPDGQPIAITGGADGTIRLWDPATGTPRSQPLPAHDRGVPQLAVATLPDGQPIAITGGADGTIRLWDLEHTIRVATSSAAQQPGDPSSGVELLAVTTPPGGQPVAITGDGRNGTVRMWDLATGSPRTGNIRAHARPRDHFHNPIRLTPHDGWISQLAAITLPDGQPIAITGGPDGTIQVWDLQSGTPRTDKIRAYEPGNWSRPEGVEQLAVATLRDGQPIAITGGPDGEIRVWDLQSDTPRTDAIPAHPTNKLVAELLAVTATLPDGQAIAISGGDDGSIRLWDLPALTPRTDAIPAHQPGDRGSRGVEQLAVATLRDGQPIAISGGDGSIRLWDLPALTPRTDPLPAHSPGDKYGRAGLLQLAVATLSDGQSIAVSAGGDRVCTYDLAAGRIWRQISIGSQVQAIALTPDGLVVVGTHMGLLGLQNAVPGSK